MTTPKHPTQPVIVDSKGVHRFKANAILVHLSTIGMIDMNAIACAGFSIEDQRQLAQLLGYSVSGYRDLDYTAGCPARNAKPGSSEKGLDRAHVQALHDAAQAACKSLDALTHLIEIAEGTP